MILRNSVFTLTLTNQQIGNLTINVLENNVLLLNGNTYGQPGQLNVNLGYATVGNHHGNYSNGVLYYRIRGMNQQQGATTNKMGLIMDHTMSCYPPGVLYQTTWDQPHNYDVLLGIVKNYTINNWLVYPDVVEEEMATKLHKIVKVQKNWFSSVANAIRLKTNTNMPISPSNFISVLTNGYAYPDEGKYYTTAKTFHSTYGTNNLKNAFSEIGTITDHENASFYVAFNDEITDMSHMFHNCDIRNYNELMWCGPNVENMDAAYYNAVNMTGYPPVISDSVVHMNYTFWNCRGLTGLAYFGNNATYARGTYENCIGLEPVWDAKIGSQWSDRICYNMGSAVYGYWTAPTILNTVSYLNNSFVNTNVRIMPNNSGVVPNTNSMISIYDNKKYNLYEIPTANIVSVNYMFDNCKYTDPSFIKWNTKGRTDYSSKVNFSGMFRNCFAYRSFVVNHNGEYIRPVINVPFASYNADYSYMYYTRADQIVSCKDETNRRDLNLFFDISHLDEDSINTNKYNFKNFINLYYNNVSSFNANVTFMVDSSRFASKYDNLPAMFNDRNMYGLNNFNGKTGPLEWNLYVNNEYTSGGTVLDIDNYSANVVFQNYLNKVETMVDYGWHWKTEDTVLVQPGINIVVNNTTIHTNDIYATVTLRIVPYDIV